MEPSVSGETASPPVPDEARGVFADRLNLAVRFAQMLATEGVVRGLIGPREAPRLWERHLLNCAVLEEAVAPEATVCDIGSGAGLPGIVLAIVRPDVTVTLVEPLLRRTTFLDEVVADLQLPNVTVIRSRAEAHHGAAQYDVVTSRAVAALPQLLDWSLGLVASHGEVVALKGGRAATEVAEASELLLSRGCAPARVVELGRGRIDEPTWAIRIAWNEPASVAWVPGRGTAPVKDSTPSRRTRGRGHGR